MKLFVLSMSFDPDTGKPNSNPREELIDTGTNKIFKDTKTLTDIAEKYMSFWNRLPTRQREMVLVQSIRRVEE